jgi:sugar/nucleoside kinase (ribokinase family)
MTVWIVGPVAWDTVVYTDEWLTRGAFTQGQKFVERSGGTAANVARALSTAKVDTGFVGYLGNDQRAIDILAELEQSDIAHLELTHIQGATSHVLILVDGDGERTILGLAPDHLDVVNLSQAKLQREDTVVFVLWRDHFLADLELAQASGCKVVVGLDAVNDPRVKDVDVAIGSHNDLASDFDKDSLLDRFKRVVITRGAEGAVEYSASGQVSQPAIKTEVVDATGAGDAFLAGYLAASALGDDDSRLLLGSRWAAKTVATEASVPPHFSTI